MDVRSNSIRHARDWARKRPELISKLSLESEAGKKFSIDLNGRVTLIGGLNGGGKTSLLRALYAHIDGQDSPERLPFRVVASNIAHETVDQALYIDAVESIIPFLQELKSDPNLDDRFEGIDPADFGPDLLKMANYALGREYQAIEYHELTSTGEDEVIFPFFGLCSNGVHYDSFRAGRGEVSALYILWALSRAPRNSIALLEEPESGLSQHSQSRLIDTAILLAKSRSLQLIISSHHYTVVSSVPPSSVILVRSLPPRLSQFDSSPDELRHALGIKTLATLTIFVEDTVAAQLLRAIVTQIDPLLDGMIAIRIAADGDSQLLRIAKHTHRFGMYVDSICCIADGDARSKTSFSNAGLLFLPGSEAPEVFLKNLIESELRAEAASVLSIPILNAHQAAEGVDIHDWIHQVSVPAGGISNLIHALVPVMKQDETVWNQCVELVENIRSCAVKSRGEVSDF